ncbi:leucine-rich repeat-containing protein 25 [Paroedura picta]|uniref:leucine-rich repeat-containing protein 25 n=1 Tax=Paroedura picta TaxID=143630 RepID=UPI004055FB51
MPEPKGQPHNSRDQQKDPDVRMQALLATLLLLLHLQHPLEAACPAANLMNRTSPSGILNWEWLGTPQACMNLSGTNIASISGTPGWRSPLKELDLSHNSLSSLPAGFLDHTEGLERLFLHGNCLPGLPAMFFEKTSRLKELRLEGNPLTSIPTSLLRLCLETLHVDCRCDVAGSIFPYCQRQLNCTQSVSCLCSSPRGFLNVTGFYAQQCQGLPVAVAAAVTASVLALLVGAAVAYVLVRRKRRASMVQEKRESTGSNGAQPRYISHTGPQFDVAQAKGGQADYENVFIGQPKEARGRRQEQSRRKQPKSRSLQKSQEKEPPPTEQPVYANTQEVYYNYVGTPTSLEEDVYVTPDQ